MPYIQFFGSISSVKAKIFCKKEKEKLLIVIKISNEKRRLERTMLFLTYNPPKYFWSKLLTEFFGPVPCVLMLLFIQMMMKKKFVICR